jgi:GAF domain-containing protein
LFDPAQDTLYLVAQINFAAVFVESFGQVRPGHGSVCARAMDLKKSVYVSDVLADGEFAGLQALSDQSGVRAIQSTPILSQTGTLLGIFSTHFLQPRQFNEADRKVCADYALRFSRALGANRPY